MPIPRVTERTCTTPPRPQQGGGSGGAAVSLPILSDPKLTVRKSRMGPRRVAVLIAVHLVIAAHIAHWLIKGRTLSPVEPSESMYTINNGALNAGFVFFAVAILSTVVFGRFFCGWGCHIVAVQDLCAWMMKRIGIHPKPFRSRLLVYAPVILALYMFAWPTLKREVIRPVMGDSNWATIAPYVGEAGARPELKAAFIKKDFWETFAPWYVAIPFIGVCGFACVYFLGAKGFCTYGCPYGGIFGPVDRLAPGRIRVTDACEHCGHCTAVCTSNVRVHEEVRDFGMVVDPGCMKCMDCVSVCPNEALYFGFGMPALAAKPKADIPAKRFKSRIYDLSWKEEFAYGLVFLILVFGFRGMLGLVPLLMAMGLAGVGTFLLWKLVSMARTPNVRIHSFQLKLKGAIRPAGIVFAALAAASIASGLWGAVANGSLWLGTSLDARITTSFDQVLVPDFVPTERDRAIARTALPWLLRAGPVSARGWGWDRSVDRSLRIARLHAIGGDLSATEADLRSSLADAAAAHANPPSVLENDLIRVLRLRCTTSEEFTRELSVLLQAYSGMASTRLILAQHAIQEQRNDEAISLIQAALANRPLDEMNRAFSLELLRQIGRADLYLEVASDGVAQTPQNVVFRMAYGVALDANGQTERALVELIAAADLDPLSPQIPAQIVEILRRSGRESEATAWQDRANRALREPRPPTSLSPSPPPP